MNGVDISNIKRPETPWALSPDGIQRPTVKLVLEDGQYLTWDDEEKATLHTPAASTCTCEMPKPERQGLIVDRGRRTTMVHCGGCGQKWDRPDGSNEFSFWAMGFTEGKRATMLKASETAEPEMGSWDQEHISRIVIPLESTPGIAVESPLTESARFSIERATEPDTQIESLVGWPEWFLPLMKLRGFTYGKHLVAIDHIVTRCKAMGITPELVVATFVAYWSPRRDQARWECPVAGLWDELGKHMDDVAQAPPHRLAAVREMANASVGPEYGCRYCWEGGFIWVNDVGPGGSGDRWPIVCDHTVRMANMGQGGPPWAWQPRGWNLVQEALKKWLAASVYTSWIIGLELLGFDAKVALVKCYNRTHATWIYRQLIETLRATLETELAHVQDGNLEDLDLEMMMVWERDADAAERTY